MIENIDGINYLSAMAFERHSEHRRVREEATELVSLINNALQVAYPDHELVAVDEIAERLPDGAIRRHYNMSVGVGRIRARGYSVGIAVPVGGNVQAEPTLSEKTALLLHADRQLYSASQELGRRPITWAAIRIVYETVRRYRDPHPNPQKSNYSIMVDAGWITQDEASKLYKTSQFYLHGYPRVPLDPVDEIDIYLAAAVVRKLFGFLMDFEWQKRRSELAGARIGADC